MAMPASEGPASEGPARERRGLSVAGVLRLLEPFPGRLEFAIRLAVLCALTVLCAEIYQTPEPALTTYIAFFVTKRDRAESVVGSIIMLLLITLIIGVVILISKAVLDYPLWRVTTMTLTSPGLW